jgi:hypothetical protein
MTANRWTVAPGKNVPGWVYKFTGEKTAARIIARWGEGATFERPPPPELERSCPVCRAPRGQPCLNYRGQAKPPCRERAKTGEALQLVAAPAPPGPEVQLGLAIGEG